jgi:hypothetical protein
VTVRNWTPDVPESRGEREHRIRRRLGRWTITAGRVLLVGAPLLVGILWLVPIPWSTTSSGPSFWMPEAALLVTVLWLTLLPAMLLPVTPIDLVEVSEGKLTGPTVLGRRSVDLEAARVVLSVPLPSKSTSSVLHLVRDQRGWMLVDVDGLADLSGAEPPETIFAAARKRKLRWYVHLVAALGVVAWFGGSIVAGTVLLILALDAR